MILGWGFFLIQLPHLVCSQAALQMPLHCMLGAWVGGVPGFHLLSGLFFAFGVLGFMEVGLCQCLSVFVWFLFFLCNKVTNTFHSKK